MTTNSTNSSQGYEVIGTRPVRHDGIEKVTGQAVFGADVRLPGMLYGAVLRSPYAHARIISIDTSQAEALSGVKAVVTAADLPAIEPGDDSLRYQSNNNISWQTGKCSMWAMRLPRWLPRRLILLRKR